MRYRVIWPNRAIQALAQAYLSAKSSRDTSAVNAAAEGVDRILEVDPSTAGESRTAEQRILVVPPLWVDFEVFQDELTVVVDDVRYRP